MNSVVIILRIFLALMYFAMPLGFIYLFWFIMHAILKSASQSYFKNNVVKNDTTGKIEYIDLEDDIIKRDFNKESLKSLKDKFYNYFLEFEKAYNNLDYNTMHSISCKPLYTKYYDNIKYDLVAGNKRIIDNISKNEVIIYGSLPTSYGHMVSTVMDISYTTCLMNKKGQVLSGNKDEIVRERFEVKFTKNYTDEKIQKCPNCGASVDGVRCDYCRSLLTNNDYKIYSIRKIID